MHQQFPLQDPPKCNRIAVFGLKMNHLATLVGILLFGIISFGKLGFDIET
jgi:hypothetical protein